MVRGDGWSTMVCSVSPEEPRRRETARQSSSPALRVCMIGGAHVSAPASPPFLAGPLRGPKGAAEHGPV
jgi:hypothetical protein